MRNHIIATLLAFVAFPLFAEERQASSLVDERIDSLSHSHSVIGFDGNKPTQEDVDSLSRMIESYYYNQFHHSQDPDAPYFLFLSKDAALSMGIGGVVRMRGWYEWGGAIPVNGFAPALIPIPENPAMQRRFGTTPSGTALYFRVIGRSRVVGAYQFYIEANFNGYKGRDFHLKKAYAVVRNLTVGYASSTFSDPAAIPPTVDAQGPVNKLAATTVLVRYMPSFKRWTVALSLETPETQIDASDENTEATSSWLPDAAAFVQYEWTRGQHLRLAGIVRSLGYRDLVASCNRNVAGWAVQLSSVAHPMRQLTTYVTFNYGHGYSSLCNDLMAATYDLVGDSDVPGRLYAPAAFGYNVCLQYNFTAKVFATAQFSHTRFLPRSRVAPDDYKYGYCGTINVFWNPVSRVQLGAEFDIGKRQNFSGDHRYARRLGAMVQFSF